VVPVQQRSAGDHPPGRPRPRRRPGRRPQAGRDGGLSSSASTATTGSRPGCVRPARCWWDADGRPERLVNLFKDITDRRRQTEAVETLAFKDTLTDLPNRALFQHRFQEAVSASEMLGEMFGLIMIDVDHFKDINDTLGHDAGDALLKRLADMLRHAFRADDTVARLGGDEFAVILRGLHCEADMLRPIKTLQGLLRRPIEHGGRSFTVSASIGAALHGDMDADPAHMVKNADIALYRAKDAGRNRSVVFQPSMRSALEQRIELLRDVRAASRRASSCCTTSRWSTCAPATAWSASRP
jgi:diguanylate cyclase (GGDEF)-like protein